MTDRPAALQRPRRAGPIEGVLETRGVAGRHLGEIDHVGDQQRFILVRQTHLVQAAVVGADGDGHARIQARAEDMAERFVAFERAGAEVAGGADFKALPAPAQVFEQGLVV